MMKTYQMNLMRIKTTIAITTLIILTTVNAQTQKIRLTTSDNTQITIPLIDGGVANIDANGDIIATTSATKDQFANITGPSNVQGGSCSAVALVAPTVDMSATVTSIESGTRPNIKYTISFSDGTTSATKCIKHGGTSGWPGEITESSLLTVGTTHSILAPNNITEETTYGLTCFNTDAVESSLEQVKVNVSSIEGCPAAVDGQGIPRDTTTTLYSQVNGSAATFPNYTTGYSPDLGANKYLAWEFVMTANTDFIVTAENSNAIPEKTTIAISTCPGVFNDSELSQYCTIKGTGGIGSYRILSNDFPTYDGVCYLTPGETYYMNVIYAWKDPATGIYENGCTQFNECQMLLLNQPIF